MESGRAYLDGTNVLVTRFETARGALRLVDFMALAPEQDLRRRAFPEHELVRIAECTAGEVEVEVEADLRPGFGGRARWRDAGPLGLRVERGVELVTLRATARLVPGPDGIPRAHVRLREGEVLVLSVAYDRDAPAVLPPLEEAWEALRRTTRAWREVSARVRYDGPWRDEVVRSVLALELLSYPPTGAIVAAATTSLPERPGGDLNWDYRYCWLRDAALTVRALYGAGCTEAAVPFTDWLLHTTRLTRPALRVLYDVYGRTPPPERLVPSPRGTRRRVAGPRRQRRGGPGAARRLRRGGGRGRAVGPPRRPSRPRDAGACCAGSGRWCATAGSYPTPGSGSRASRPRLRTHSLVLGWVALTRLLELHARGAISRLPAARFARERDAIRRLVDARGFDPRLDSWVAHLDGHEVDSALLLLGWYGYDDPGSARMRGTWRRIRERLSPLPGLLYRYEPSRAAGEGAFGICSAWAIEHLARGGGPVEEAVAWLEALLARANDVGLFAEEIDPRTGAALGNFPQAFTHVGVVNAVLTLDQRVGAERERRRAAPSEARP